jgi:hypothetical protein
MGAKSSRRKLDSAESQSPSRSSSLGSSLGHEGARGSSLGARISGCTVFGTDADFEGRKNVPLSTKVLDGEDDAIMSTELPANENSCERRETASFKSNRLLDGIEKNTPTDLKTVPINLLDGTMWAVRYYQDTDKFRHAMIRLKRSHGLQYDGAYSIFAVHDGLISGEMFPINDERLLKDELRNWTGDEQSREYLFEGGGSSLIRSKNLLIRRRVYFRNSPESQEAVLAESVHSMAHTLTFIDASYAFRRGWYHHNREQLVEASALLYNALHIHSDNQSFSKDLCISSVLPHLCSMTTADALEDLLIDVKRTWKEGIFKMNGLQSEQVFCHKLSIWNKWYGSIIFTVSEASSKKLNFKYFVATETGIYVLARDQSSHIGAIVIEKFKTWPEVVSWNKNDNNELVINVVGSQNDERKSDTNKNVAWVFIVKPGNLVCIVDQLIEYSHVTKMNNYGMHSNSNSKNN